MKRFLVFGVVSVLALCSFGEPIGTGAHEIRLEASSGIGGGNSDSPAYIGGLGYYFCENIQIGGLVSLMKESGNDSYWGADDVWGLAVYGEHCFNPSGAMIPFVGVSAGFFDGDESDDSVLVLSISPGLKLFVTDTVAISGQVNVNWAGDEIYDFERDYSRPDKVEGQGEDTGFSANLGVRFLLW